MDVTLKGPGLVIALALKGPGLVIALTLKGPGLVIALTLKGPGLVICKEKGRNNFSDSPNGLSAKESTVQMNQ